MKSKFFSPLAAVSSALWVLVGGTASAESELDLRASLGYDSNVFDLNESIGERDGMFTLVEAELTAEGMASSGWIKRADIGASAQLFESRVSEGDEAWYFVRARGKSNEKRNEHGWDWALRVRMHDSKYVSRLTGVVATDAVGNKISDRFDNSIGDLRAAWHFPGGRYGRISLGGSVVSKNYLTDYAQFALERLDYNEFEITPTYELGGPDSNVRIRLIAAERQYRDRRVSDATGNPVPGTDLEYRYYGVDARFKHELTRKSALELTGGYDIREDNGVGFADRTRWNAGIEWTYRPAKQTGVTAELEWSSRVFDGQLIGDPTINDEAPDKEGYSFNIRYAMPFPGLKAHGYSLRAEAGWESFDNTDDLRFSYDRLTAFVGIRKEF